MRCARTFRSAGAAALLIAVQVGAAEPSGACGFDGVLDGSFGAMHPKSIAVAFAIRDSVESGMVKNSVTAPIVAGSAGYWRAVGHLSALQRALSVAGAGGMGSRVGSFGLSVLFIDSSLWARLTPTARGLEMNVHAAGAQSGDVVVVTSEAILAAVLDEQLPIAAALDRGLIAVDGETEAADAVRRLIAAALDAQALPVASGPETRAVRMFGPPR